MPIYILNIVNLMRKILSTFATLVQVLNGFLVIYYGLMGVFLSMSVSKEERQSDIIDHIRNRSEQQICVPMSEEQTEEIPLDAPVVDPQPSVNHSPFKLPNSFTSIDPPSDLSSPPVDPPSDPLSDPPSDLSTPTERYVTMHAKRGRF